MRTGHCFAGAGGGILADLINGHEPAWAVEWDPYCCAVLRERFPGLHVIEGDIRSVDFRGLARVDAICGGFPCQDISAAGSGVGITGERSGLFREIMRAVDALRPDWVFMENSRNIRTKGRHVVIGELVARGYSWRDGVLAASDCGAGFDRHRWWLLAKTSHVDGVRQLQSQGSEQEQRGRLGHRTPEAPDADRIGCEIGCGMDAEWIAEAGHGSAHAADPVRNGSQEPIQREGVRKTDAEAIEAVARYCGVHSWNQADAWIRGMVAGLSARTHRIKALGNAQVPLCAAVAWRLLGGPVGGMT